MNRLLALAVTVFAALAIAHADFADAARMGGGRSFGMQRSITPPAARTRRSTSNSFTGPAANPVHAGEAGRHGRSARGRRRSCCRRGSARARRAGSARSPVSQPGLGLAALFSHLGLSEGLGSLLLIGFLAVGAIFLVRAFACAAAVRAATAACGRARRTAVRFEPARSRPSSLRGARQRALAATDAAAGRYPPGFDAAPFVEQAKQQFRRLQAAYDRGDRDFLADMTTPEMHAEIARDLATRGSSQPTDIATLDAEILEVVQRRRSLRRDRAVPRHDARGRRARSAAVRGSVESRQAGGRLVRMAAGGNPAVSEAA